MKKIILLVLLSVSFAKASETGIPSENTLKRNNRTDYLSIVHKVDVRLATNACDNSEDAIRVYAQATDQNGQSSLLSISGIKDSYILPVSTLNGYIELCEDGLCQSSARQKGVYAGEAPMVVRYHPKALMATEGENFCKQARFLLKSKFAIDFGLLEQVIKKDGMAMLSTEYFMYNRNTNSVEYIGKSQDIDLKNYRNLKEGVVEIKNKLHKEIGFIEVKSNSK